MNKIFILILCILCSTIYFNSLTNSFVYDDEGLIVNNPVIKYPKFLPLIFKKCLYDYPGLGKDITFDKMYRPLQLLSYAIDYRIWKLNPFGFHLTNVLLHLFNSILIYYLFLIISNNTVSKIASTLFLVHPIHTSVVTYIAGRADLLASSFMLLSLIGFLQFIHSQQENFAIHEENERKLLSINHNIPWLKSRGSRRLIKLRARIYYIASLLSALLALYSRENALLLFIFIALILFFLKAKPKYYLYVIPFILLDLFYILLRFSVLGNHAFVLHPSSISLPLRLVNFFNIIPRYLFILAFPLDLHLFRTTPFISDLVNIKTFFAILFILFYIVLLIRYRHNRLLVFGMLWFLTGIIPVFFSLDGYRMLKEAVMAESWLYFSSVGFFIFISTQNILKKFNRIIFVSFIAFYGFLTAINNVYWKNNIILYKHISEYIPEERNPVWKNLINSYFKSGLYEDALAEIKKFSIYYPDSAQTYILWGNYYFLTGELNKAVDNYRVALTKDKNNFTIYSNLSLFYKELNQIDEAIDYGLACFKINPYHLDNLIRLGDLYRKKRQFIEANKYYSMALEIDPDNQLIKEKNKECKVIL